MEKQKSKMLRLFDRMLMFPSQKSAIRNMGGRLCGVTIGVPKK